jgi:hypothetical protein
VSALSDPERLPGYVLAVVASWPDLGKPWNFYNMMVTPGSASALFEAACCVLMNTTVLLLEFLVPFFGGHLGCYSPAQRRRRNRRCMEPSDGQAGFAAGHRLTVSAGITLEQSGSDAGTCSLSRSRGAPRSQAINRIRSRGVVLRRRQRRTA